MKEVLDTIPVLWKAATVVVGAFLAGSIVLGADVRTKLHEHDAALNTRFVGVDSKVGQLDDRVELLEEHYTVLLCLQVAELEKTPWLRCLQ